MENEAIKIAYTKNLNKLNFNSLITIPINSNVNIKTILNVHACIVENRIECSSGKAVLTGKINVKVLYVDTDNITNTLNDTQNFTETILDSGILANSYININNASVACRILSTNGTLKLSADVSISPTMYVNLPLNNVSNTFENMFVKKTSVNSFAIANIVDANFENTSILETKDSINKVLCYNCYFSPEEALAFDSYATLQGKLYSKLVYETLENDETIIKELFASSVVKTDLQIDSLSKDCLLDLSFACNATQENINIELEDNNSVISVLHKISVQGIAMKNISIDVVDDMYSTDNEVNLTKAKREFNRTLNCERVKDVINGEIQLQESEPAIDKIISNLNVVSEITNHYLKDGSLWVEGVISSQIIYEDENKQLQSRFTELPFVINTKIQLEKLDCVNLKLDIVDSRFKVKRGTLVEFEYFICLYVCLYVKDEVELVDAIAIGKPLEFGNYDYQIFIGKPEETTWEVCKRTKTSPEQLKQTNPNLPLVLSGGEKIIIKR